MKTVAAGKFKQTCLGLLEEVRQTGHPVLVTKRGRPIAQLVPVPRELRAPDWRGCMRNTGSILGDIVKPASVPDDWKALGD